MKLAEKPHTPMASRMHRSCCLAWPGLASWSTIKQYMYTCVCTHTESVIFHCILLFTLYFTLTPALLHYGCLYYVVSAGQYPPSQPSPSYEPALFVSQPPPVYGSYGLYVTAGEYLNASPCAAGRLHACVHVGLCMASIPAASCTYGCMGSQAEPGAQVDELQRSQNTLLSQKT